MNTHHVETFEGSKKSDQFDVLEADIRQEREQWTSDASFQRSVQTRIFGLIDSICVEEKPKGWSNVGSKINSIIPGYEKGNNTSMSICRDQCSMKRE